MLQATFTKLLSSFTNDSNLVTDCWSEIQKKYSGKQRHYHTLDHLTSLLEQLTGIKSELKNWDTILFTLFYHDIIYNPLKSDNEARSAELAAKRMRRIAVPDGLIETCEEQILATKSHLQSTDSDTNYFTDADLSVLGQPWDTYERYYKNVRREYAVYPDIVYNPGRRKVLNHFLAMDRIFKTPFFYERFEGQAKQNLQRELALL